MFVYRLDIDDMEFRPKKCFGKAKANTWTHHQETPEGTEFDYMRRGQVRDVFGRFSHFWLACDEDGNLIIHQPWWEKKGLEEEVCLETGLSLSMLKAIHMVVESLLYEEKSSPVCAPSVEEAEVSAPWDDDVEDDDGVLKVSTRWDDDLEGDDDVLMPGVR